MKGNGIPETTQIYRIDSGESTDLGSQQATLAEGGSITFSFHL
jgi:hypothetical protein